MNALNLPEFKVIGTQDMLYGSFDFSPPKLVEGFGVSIPQLLEVIERDEF